MLSGRSIGVPLWSFVMCVCIPAASKVNVDWTDSFPTLYDEGKMCASVQMLDVEFETKKYEKRFVLQTLDHTSVQTLQFILMNKILCPDNHAILQALPDFMSA